MVRPYVVCHMMSSVDGRIDAELLEAESFHPRSAERVGSTGVHVARRAESYAVAADPMGKLYWKASEIEGDHIVCLLTEASSAEYVAMLRERRVSYIVSSGAEIDFARAFALLAEEFGVKRLLLEGGGHINGAVLQAGLVDEVSLLLIPVLDGRKGVPASFDGLSAGEGFGLQLKSVDRMEGDILALRYQVKRSGF